MQCLRMVTTFLLFAASIARAAAGAPEVTSATPVYYQLVLDSAMFSGGNPKDVKDIVLDLEQVRRPLEHHLRHCPQL